MSAFLIAFSVSTNAATIVLDFEGVATYYPSSNDNNLIIDFYNGGTSISGTSGTDYGVAFTSPAIAICLNTPGAYCTNTSRGGLGDPDSQLSGLASPSDDIGYFMNVAAGFDTGISFYYSAHNQIGSINIYDGLNGTGSLLATLALGLTPDLCDASYQANFCPFFASGIGFSGTAKSVYFPAAIVFDDVTLGSVIPGTVIPTPPALLLFVSGILGLIGFARKKAA